MTNRLIIISIFSALALLMYKCKNPYAQGKALYVSNCQSCHQENGQALKKLIPPLAQSDYLKNEKEQLPCIIRNGMRGEIVVNGVTYDGVMGEAPHLSDVEITNIINYINNAWGNENGYTTLEEVQKSLESCAE